MSELILKGQKILYNHEKKVAIIEIMEPFYKAGKIFDWKDKKTPGLGINTDIVNFVIKRKATLLIKVKSTGNTYWLRNDLLADFISKTPCNYKVGENTWVNVIPWEMCTRQRTYAERQEGIESFL